MPATPLPDNCIMHAHRAHDRWLFSRCLLSGLAAIVVFLLFAPAFAVPKQLSHPQTPADKNTLTPAPIHDAGKAPATV